MTVVEIDMNPIIWFIVLGPPCLAFVIWKGSSGPRTKDVTITFGFKADMWQRVSLGKYGFWILLAIIYTVTLATAFVDHII
jgi:hypothetical protein